MNSYNLNIWYLHWLQSSCCPNFVFSCFVSEDDNQSSLTKLVRQTSPPTYQICTCQIMIGLIIRQWQLPWLPKNPWLWPNLVNMGIVWLFFFFNSFRFVPEKLRLKLRHNWMTGWPCRRGMPEESRTWTSRYGQRIWLGLGYWWLKFSLGIGQLWKWWRIGRHILHGSF